MQNRLRSHLRVGGLFSLVVVALSAATSLDAAGTSGLECPNVMVNGWESREGQWVKNPPTNQQCLSFASIAEAQGPKRTLAAVGTPEPYNSYRYCGAQQRATDCRTAYIEGLRKAEEARSKKDAEREAKDEARSLAEQLGVSESEAKRTPGKDRDDAADLARQLGVERPDSAPNSEGLGKDALQARNLAQQLAQWDEAQMRKEQQAAVSREREARLADEENRRRRAQMLAQQQQQDEYDDDESTSADQRPDEGPGLLGLLAGAATSAVIGKQLGADPMESAMGYLSEAGGGAPQRARVPESSRSDDVSGTDDCENDLALRNRLRDAMAKCSTDIPSICGEARAMMSCFAEADRLATGCPSMQTVARNYYDHYAGVAREYCAK